MSNSIYRKWAYQPLALPGDTQYIVYRVRERRDSRGDLVEERLETMPGLCSLSLAVARVTVLNNQNVIPKGVGA